MKHDTLPYTLPAGSTILRDIPGFQYKYKFLNNVSGLSLSLTKRGIIMVVQSAQTVPIDGEETAVVSINTAVLLSEEPGQSSGSSALPLSASAFFSSAGTYKNATANSPKLCGFGNTLQYTPSSTGIIRITIWGVLSVSAAAIQSVTNMYYGLVSGGVPAAGSAPTGTAAGGQGTQGGTAISSYPFSLSYRIKVGTLNVAWWFDVTSLVSIANDGIIGPFNAEIEELAQ